MKNKGIYTNNTQLNYMAQIQTPTCWFIYYTHIMSLKGFMKYKFLRLILKKNGHVTLMNLKNFDYFN